MSVAHVYVRMMKYFRKNVAAKKNPKHDRLEYKQFGRKVNELYIIYRNVLKVIQVFYNQITDSVA